ncbi:MAG: NTP transferase domain-containing protein [Hyphomicrobium sp.]|uniref:NTP transferase domain-containing protein n=1 Tax=Hyphomicrobium sp. TaxID=82 RepID=UPI003D09E326
MNEPPRCTAIVLAGSRDPGADPVARAAGVPIKALASVGGTPMLARVLDALAASGRVARIAVVIDPETLRLPPPALSELLQRPGLSTLPAADSPSASVVAALDRLGDDVFPCLVTTADHALLTAEMVGRFLDDLDPHADAGVALVTARAIERRYPHAVRTFYRLGSERYSGCNLFLLRRPAARRLPLFWQELERHRKRPWRLIAAIGIAPFAKFLLGRLDLAGAMGELTRLTGARAAAVVLPFPEAAIDVDKPGDLALAEEILRQRG